MYKDVDYEPEDNGPTQRNNGTTEEVKSKWNDGITEKVKSERNDEITIPSKLLLFKKFFVYIYFAYKRFV
jgi:hypothetical protein